MKLTAETLKGLGFVTEISTPPESGEKNGYYYFTLDVCGLCLITDASGDNEDEFTVTFFYGDDDIKITDYDLLNDLIKILNRVSNK